MQYRMWTSSGRQTLLWWPETFTIFYILLPTQFNSLGQFKTTSKMWITSWFIVHSQCPASCVEAKMRAPRPSAVARIIGHWRAAPAFSSTREVKTINKSRSIDAQLMESQFFGIQPQLPRFIEVNLRANGKPMWQMHQQCCPYKDCWEDMAVCCMCSHVSCGRLESHHSFHTVKVLRAPAMHAEQNRHTRESWYASWLQRKLQGTVSKCKMLRRLQVDCLGSRVKSEKGVLRKAWKGVRRKEFDEGGGHNRFHRRLKGSKGTWRWAEADLNGLSQKWFQGRLCANKR